MAQVSLTTEIHTGAVLAVDIGNSTKYLLQGGRGLEGSVRLEQTITDLSNEVYRERGSVMSFTGDGFIALFEASQFLEPALAAENALQVAIKVCNRVLGTVGEGGLTARAALHWGEFYVPASGQLREQLIGPDVVCATRLCDWLAKTIEPAVPPRDRKALIAATSAFHSQVPDTSKKKRPWEFWGEDHFKGLEDNVQIYLLPLKQ